VRRRPREGLLLELKLTSCWLGKAEGGLRVDLEVSVLTDPARGRIEIVAKRVK
jgi:hypothetical protein